ncbi:hypothetical protein G6F35_017648 [Rhizopus arrhizus]|uniref:Uncharacterized protein n=1 Tax=Rhizopus oryzae TaxID=64495 RepID=A0A9P6WU66_RHIOR|nr:hypothetical protein G6F35_017648 [Rhizopus arrhizus]KAG1286723.1 hypothetical protein G6F64_014175 [Rhizopus arrhizus]
MTALAQHPRRALELLGAGTLDEQRNRGREGEVVYVQAVKTQVVGAAEQEDGLADLAGHAGTGPLRVALQGQQPEIGKGFGIQGQGGFGLAGEHQERTAAQHAELLFDGPPPW